LARRVLDVPDEVVSSYSEQWPELFQRERDRLLRVLGPWLVSDVEHVGSTAVPGMAAKPVIDMIAGVSDLSAAHEAVDQLRALDYHYRPHRPEALLFDKPHIGTWRGQTHHLHLTELNSDLWRERLAFRDALRADPSLVQEYSEWKRRHALDADEGPYSDSKRSFVFRVLAARGIDLKPDAQRLSPDAMA
jgi:GrpB-like predicted nucleotidyltransferase (UPF0157 family)